METVKREDRLEGVCRVPVETPEVGEKKLCTTLALNEKDREQKGLLNRICRLSLLILTVSFYLLIVDAFIPNRRGMRIYDFGGNAVLLWPFFLDLA